MVQHKHRLVGLVLFALIEAAVLLLPAFDVIDAETAETAAKALLGVLTALGVIDAAMVERRRRNPAIPAVSDDVRDVAASRPPHPPFRARCCDLWDRGHREGCPGAEVQS